MTFSIKDSREIHKRIGLKSRWKDVVIWGSFWEELEEKFYKRLRESWNNGYKQGKKDAKGPKK